LNIENSGSECEFKIFSVKKTEGRSIRAKPALAVRFLPEDGPNVFLQCSKI
jgi:hypothetical protein